MASHVFLAALDSELRQALIRRLSRAGELEFTPLAVFEGLHLGDVVVTTSPHCSVSLCASLAGQGVRVVVLAPLPSAQEEAEYLKAGGSAYLPMVIDVEPLQRELVRLTGHSH